MVKIAKVVGIDDVDSYIKKFPNCNVPAYFEDKRQNWAKKPWDKFVTSSNQRLIDEKVFPLLHKMLTLDHTGRPTATEAIRDPYFDSVRMEYEHELI